MKALAHQVFSFHFKAELSPIIENCHNSDQRDEAVAENVARLLHESAFLQGPLDSNVSFSLRDDQPH